MNEKKPLKELAALALSFYMLSVALAVPYFNWQYAKRHGFASWLMLGEVVATAQALVWPYYALAGRDDAPKCTDAEKDAVRSLRFGKKVLDHDLSSSGQAVLVRFDSTAIDTVAWGYPEKCLMVKFQNKAPYFYLYKDVPLETVQGLLLADSTGRYFNAHIKGKFEYRRVPLEELR